MAWSLLEADFPREICSVWNTGEISSGGSNLTLESVYLKMYWASEPSLNSLMGWNCHEKLSWICQMHFSTEFSSQLTRRKASSATTSSVTNRQTAMFEKTIVCRVVMPQVGWITEQSGREWPWGLCESAAGGARRGPRCLTRWAPKFSGRVGEVLLSFWTGVWWIEESRRPISLSFFCHKAGLFWKRSALSRNA